MCGADISSIKKHGGTSPRPKAKSTKKPVTTEATHSSADNTVDVLEAEAGFGYFWFILSRVMLKKPLVGIIRTPHSYRKGEDNY